jgi:hypothetical protein
MAESQNVPKRPRVDDAPPSSPDPLAALIAANIALQQQLALAAEANERATEANERAAALAAEDVRKANERAAAAVAAATEDTRRANEEARVANERVAKANERVDAATEDARVANAAIEEVNKRAAAAAAEANDRVVEANERAAAAVAAATEDTRRANEDTRRANEDTRRAYSIIETAVGAMKEMVTMSHQNVTNVRSIQASETSLVRYIKSEDTPDAKRFVCVTFERDDEIVRAQFIDTDRFDDTEAIAARHSKSKRTRTICGATAFEMEEVVRDHGNEILKRRKIESVS